MRTFQDALARVTAKCRRLNQTRLAQLAQGTREDAVRQARSSQPFVHAAMPGEPAPADASNPIGDLGKQLAEMKSVMAAMEKKISRTTRGRSPSPPCESPAACRKGACLHCGRNSHTKDCRVLEKGKMR